MSLPAPATTALTLLEGVITDCAVADELVTGWASHFVARAEKTLAGLSAHYSSFTPDGAARAALLALLVLDALPAEPSWVAVRRYQPGDYALPHRLRAELEDAADGVRWALVCPLANAATDGITVWDGERFVRVLDKAGRAVAAAPEAWCWTSPVRGRTRYTVSLGGHDAGLGRHLRSGQQLRGNHRAG